MLVPPLIRSFLRAFSGLLRVLCPPGYYEVPSKSGPAVCRMCQKSYYCEGGTYQDGACTQCASLDDEPSVTRCLDCTGPEPEACTGAECSDGYGNFRVADGSCNALACTTTSPLSAEQGYNVTEISLFGPTFNVSATCLPGFAGSHPVALVCTADGEYRLSGCQQCQPGQYAGPAASSCEFCSSGKADMDSDPATECSECSAGTGFLSKMASKSRNSTLMPSCSSSCIIVYAKHTRE
mgnify:CR=1 FL=1